MLEMLEMFERPFSGLLTDEEEGETKKSPLPKFSHTYHTMLKLSTVIPYITKIQTIYISLNTPLGFC